MTKTPWTTSRIRPTTLTLAVAAAALVLTATGGAVAGTMITGAQIKNGTIASADVANRSLRTKDLAPATVAQLKGKAGAPGSARGYAQVLGTNVTKQSGGITVSTPVAGTHCVTVPGVSSATSSAVVSVDYSHSGTQVGSDNAQGFAEISPNSCDAPAFGVRTFVRTYPNANTTTLTAISQGFTILVP